MALLGDLVKRLVPFAHPDAPMPHDCEDPACAGLMLPVDDQYAPNPGEPGGPPVGVAGVLDRARPLSR